MDKVIDQGRAFYLNPEEKQKNSYSVIYVLSYSEASKY